MPKPSSNKHLPDDATPRDVVFDQKSPQATARATKKTDDTPRTSAPRQASISTLHFFSDRAGENSAQNRTLERVKEQFQALFNV